MREQVEHLARSLPDNSVLEEGLRELREEVQRLTRQLLPGMLRTLGGKLDSLRLAMEGLESPQEELLRVLRKTRQDVLVAVEKRGAFVCSCSFFFFT